MIGPSRCSICNAMVEEYLLDSFGACQFCSIQNPVSHSLLNTQALQEEQRSDIMKGTPLELSSLDLASLQNTEEENTPEGTSSLLE